MRQLFSVEREGGVGQGRASIALAQPQRQLAPAHARQPLPTESMATGQPLYIERLPHAVLTCLVAIWLPSSWLAGDAKLASIPPAARDRGGPKMRQLFSVGGQCTFRGKAR